MRFHHRSIPIVLAAVLIDTIGFSIVIPVFPQLITTLGEVDLAEATRIAGYLLVVFAATQFIAGPIVGSLSDRFGRRPVLIASMLAFSADFALTAFAPSLAWLFLARAFAGVAGAVYSPASAVIADVTPPEKRAATFGLIGAAFGIGFVVGPGIGGLLSTLGPKAPFIAAALLALANAIAMILFMPETHRQENRRPFVWKTANIVGAFGPLLREREARPLLVAWFLWILAHNVYPATWGFWAAITLGWDGPAIGWSLVASGAVMALVQMTLTGRVIARVGERRAVVMGLAWGGLIYVGYALTTQGWMVYALIAVGIGQWWVQPSMTALLSRMSDPTRQGALQGGIASMMSLTSIVGPLMLTQALASGARVGFPGAAFALSAGLVAVALSIVVIFVLHRVPPKVA